MTRRYGPWRPEWNDQNIWNLMKNQMQKRGTDKLRQVVVTQDIPTSFMLSARTFQHLWCEVQEHCMVSFSFLFIPMGKSLKEWNRETFRLDSCNICAGWPSEVTWWTWAPADKFPMAHTLVSQRHTNGCYWEQAGLAAVLWKEDQLQRSKIDLCDMKKIMPTPSSASFSHRRHLKFLWAQRRPNGTF